MGHFAELLLFNALTSFSLRAIRETPLSRPTKPPSGAGVKREAGPVGLAPTAIAVRPAATDLAVVAGLRPRHPREHCSILGDRILAQYDLSHYCATSPATPHVWPAQAGHTCR
jgi:hypothetical protein